MNSSNRQCILVAHRGASRDAPENTLPAFRLAWAQDADAIEGDFRLTGDGEIVCIHDTDTKRVTGQKLVVSGTPLEHLRALDTGAYKGEQYRGTMIPTLAEVLAIVPAGKKIYIEIKSDETILPGLLDAIISSELDSNQAVIISFNPEVIRYCKQYSPEYRALLLCAIQHDIRRRILPSLGTVLTTLERISADGFSSSRNCNDENFVRSIVDAGYEYHVWTVDDAPTARRFIQWGASSITSNIPGELRKQLEQ